MELPRASLLSQLMGDMILPEKWRWPFWDKSAFAQERAGIYTHMDRRVATLVGFWFRTVLHGLDMS